MADSRRSWEQYGEAGAGRRSRWDRSSKEERRDSKSSSQGEDLSSSRHERSRRDASSPSRSHRDRSPLGDRHKSRTSGTSSSSTGHHLIEYKSEKQRERSSTGDLDDRPRRRRFTEDEAERPTSTASFTKESPRSHSTNDRFDSERLPGSREEEEEEEEEEETHSTPKSSDVETKGFVSDGIARLSQYDDIDERKTPLEESEELDGEPVTEPFPKFSGFGIMTKSDLLDKRSDGNLLAAKKPVAPIKMSLGVQKPKAPPAIKKAPAVANIFGEDDDSDEEEMPAAAKMRMRNIGRDTPTAAGPNSFGKGRLGFCDRQKIIQREIQKKMEDTGPKT